MAQPKIRNWTAVAAHLRTGAGAHKNKRISKGGGRNYTNDYLAEYLEEQYAEEVLREQCTGEDTH